MLPFTYFYFSPLTLAEFHANYPYLSKEDAAEAYEYWLIDYNFNSQRFYRAQHEQHLSVLRREFQLINGISEGELSDERWSEEWEQFYEDANMPRLKERTEREAQKVEGITRDIYERRLGVRDPLIPGHYFVEMIMREITLGGPPDHKVYGPWFNTIINNPPTVQRQLRKLPYKEYLYSDHWRKVRAAVLLSYKAVCQAESCWSTGESWYGGNWEADIHVHHFHYRNRGNERYEDLTLLCSRHHEQWHKHEKDPQQPEVKIAFHD